MSRQMPLEKLAGEIRKAEQKRIDATNVEDWCYYHLQVRRYKRIYNKAEKLGMTLEQIRDYSDGGVI